MNALQLPLEHLVLPTIRWPTFERILDEMGKRRLRIAYNDGNLEFMSVGLWHHRVAQCIGRLIFLAALETKTPIRSGGSTTLKSPPSKVAIEPDECFWIKHEKQMRGKKKWNALTDPPPDLAVEVDITTSWLDRLEIYAALEVPEVWRFDGESFKVLILGSSGKYNERAKSLAFPSLPMGEFVGFIKKLETSEEIALTQEFTDWLRSTVVAKKANGERKNGRR